MSNISVEPFFKNCWECIKTMLNNGDVLMALQFNKVISSDEKETIKNLKTEENRKKLINILMTKDIKALGKFIAIVKKYACGQDLLVAILISEYEQLTGSSFNVDDFEIDENTRCITEQLQQMAISSNSAGSTLSTSQTSSNSNNHLKMDEDELVFVVPPEDFELTYKGLSTIVNLFKQERDMYEQNTWTIVLHQLINDDPLKIALLNKKFINGDYIPAFRELIESWIGFQSINATFNTLVAILKLEIGLNKLANNLMEHKVKIYSETIHKKCW